jgi:hypothetical protein
LTGVDPPCDNGHLRGRSGPIGPEILLGADSYYCCPEVPDWYRANGLDCILGVAPNTTLRWHIEGLKASTKER